MSDAVTESPDKSAHGLLDSVVPALRYDQPMVVAKEDPHEVAGIVRRWMPEQVRVLDVGCGAGALTLRITQRKHNNVLGIEPDPTRADVARSRGLDVISGFLDESFIAAHEPFNVIMFTDVLEHVAAPSQFLALANKALARDGMIVASVPNVAHWTVRLNLLFGRFEYASIGIMDATHLRWFTLKTARRLFENQGFKVAEISTSAGIWMEEYARFPFKLMPGRVRRLVIRTLNRLLPGLFGCQILIKAQRADDPGSSTLH